ncbi:MAG: DUF4142 domain-containing protein [Planctomycetaceae bacterium]|nr:DUF4142 domain-containing protein [Planctomycetaceae bacterium]
MFLSRVCQIGAVCALLALPSAVKAQQQQEQKPGQRANPAAQNEPARPDGTRQADRRTPGDQQAHGRISDSQLAACLIIDNQKEIALAEFVAQKTQNEDVKAFAQKMIQGHQQIVQQLHDLAAAGGYQTAQLSIDAGAQRDATQADRGQPGARTPQTQRNPETADSPTARRAARPELGEGHGVDFITLKREMAQQCLQTARHELEQKSGAEFDECYMWGQVMGHMAMNDALQVISRHASPELQEVLRSGQQTTKDHLAQAKKITEQLEKGDKEGRQRERENR